MQKNHLKFKIYIKKHVYLMKMLQLRVRPQKCTKRRGVGPPPGAPPPRLLQLVRRPLVPLFWLPDFCARILPRLHRAQPVVGATPQPGALVDSSAWYQIPN